jgi:hypothetical protein
MNRRIHRLNGKAAVLFRKAKKTIRRDFATLITASFTCRDMRATGRTMFAAFTVFDAWA